MRKNAEAVNHPSHYHKDSGVEVIDAIEAWGLGFSLGNAVRAFGTWLRVAGWPWIVRRYRRLRERWNDYRDYGE